MATTVNAAAGATAAAKALEARRQEILKSAQGEGGAQSRAVQSGRRKAQAAAQLRTQAQAQTQTAAASSPKTAAPGATGTSTTQAAPVRKVGWEVTLDDKSYTAMKQATDAATRTGSALDVMG